MRCRATWTGAWAVAAPLAAASDAPWQLSGGEAVRAGALVGLSLLLALLTDAIGRLSCRRLPP